MCAKLDEISHFAKDREEERQFLEGSFAAVPKPMFAGMLLFFSSFALLVLLFFIFCKSEKYTKHANGLLIASGYLRSTSLLLPRRELQ